MSPPMFWLASLDAVGTGSGEVVVLDGPEGHHAAVVRRLAAGERVRVSDGRGAYVEGPVRSVGKGSVEVQVEQRVAVPAPTLRLTVVQAVPKRDQAEQAVQALVEVGVDRVVPWAAERSQVRVGAERGQRLLTRWQAWALEAGKRARRAWFCEVAEVASTAQVAALAVAADVAVVLHEEASQPLSSVPLPAAGAVLLVVGPEGGIGAAELAALGVGGRVRAVRLGDSVLRTSTAGAVAAGVVLSRTRWR